jgi:hypothetical protein
MVKCLECGANEKRLQWTHFRYKCTGKFKNGKEYQAAYPGAKIIDSDLAKKTAVTLKNLQAKYGEIEGQRRWDEYRKKQAVTNSFEYKKEKYGWTKEQFDEYNSSRAQTLEKMIARHGEEIGITKWEEYCDRQAYTNTKNYFVEKYGHKAGLKKYLEINRKKAVSNPQILAEKLGVSIDGAVQIIINRQKQFFTSNLEVEFIRNIEEKIGPLDHTSLKNPFGKWSETLKSYVVFDIKHKNCIIEFNGDYWHANPAIYCDTAIIRGKTAIEIRTRDMLKLETAKDHGFKTLVIWESDYKRNKNEIIMEVVKWILSEQQ